MHHKCIQALPPQHVNTRNSCSDRRVSSSITVVEAYRLDAVVSERPWQTEAADGRRRRAVLRIAQAAQKGPHLLPPPPKFEPDRRFNKRRRRRCLLRFLNWTRPCLSPQVQREERTEQIRSLEIKGGAGLDSLLQNSADFSFPFVARIWEIVVN